MSRETTVTVKCDRCGLTGLLPQIAVEKHLTSHNKPGPGGWALFGSHDLCHNCQDKPTTVTLELSTPTMSMSEIGDMLADIVARMRKWDLTPRQELFLDKREDRGASCRVLVNRDYWRSTP